jgi:DNA-binding MarR family transcriptional regulator
VGEVADYLLLRHHSAVGLIDRAEAARLIHRVRDDDDHRVVRLRLSADGAKRIEKLAALHVEELNRLGAPLTNAWEGLGPVQREDRRVENVKIY